MAIDTKSLTTSSCVIALLNRTSGNGGNERAKLERELRGAKEMIFQGLPEARTLLSEVFITKPVRFKEFAFF